MLPPRQRWQRSLETGAAVGAGVPLAQRRRPLPLDAGPGPALAQRARRNHAVDWHLHRHPRAQAGLERIDEAQRELRANNEQLTRANVDLDNFIYTASHDLKAPITNIEGLLHALLAELPPPCCDSPDGAAPADHDAGLGGPLSSAPSSTSPT